MTSQIKSEQIKRLKTMRDDASKRIDYDRQERLRKQREREAIADFWVEQYERDNKHHK